MHKLYDLLFYLNLGLKLGGVIVTGNRYSTYHTLELFVMGNRRSIRHQANCVYGTARSEVRVPRQLVPSAVSQIWHFDETKKQWAQQGKALEAHTDWVRDVAWAPNLGMPMNTIASAGQDGKVVMWTEQNNEWKAKVSHICKCCSTTYQVLLCNAACVQH